MFKKAIIALLCLVLVLTVSGCGGVESSKGDMKISPSLVMVNGGYPSNNLHYCYDKRTGVVYFMWAHGITVCFKADGTPMTIAELVESEKERNNGNTVDSLQRTAPEQFKRSYSHHEVRET